MPRSCGATFGFGGKLVSFANVTHPAADASGQAKMVDSASISITQVRSPGKRKTQVALA